MSDTVSLFIRAGAVALALALASPVRAACDWATAKKDIEQVLDQVKEKGEEFRKVVKAGRDSLDALEKLADPAARARIKECGYEAGELLTQRGFPPLH